MRRFRTTAPQAYDYGYTTQVDPDPATFADMQNPPQRVVRTVEIPDEAAEYQTDRYRSGLYLVEEVETTA